MFGISCAPEIFQKILEQVLSGCEGCMNYIDDIIVYAANVSEHDRRLAKVMKRLSDYNITLNHDKCVYRVKSLEFLGHRLSYKGIEPAVDKVAAIKQFRAPVTAEEVRSFLGLVNYVGKFIPDLSTRTNALRELTKQGVPFDWTDEHTNAFNDLKSRMSNTAILGYYNVNDRTQVVADASPVGLGAVLIQFDNRGPRIISFASRGLTDVEKRYAQTEKEALALVWSIERFHHYLYGRSFELVTDHKPLETIFGPRSRPCARIERWVLRLQSYKYKVMFRPGKSNIADPLSRLACSAPSTLGCNLSKVSTDYVNWVIDNAEPKAVKITEIESVSAKDADIDAVREALTGGEWSERAMPYKAFENEFCFRDDILLRGTLIVVPMELRERLLQLAHEGHPGISVMKQRLRAKVWWPKLDKDVEGFVKKCFGCTITTAPDRPEPMKRTELPNAPWQHLAMDYCGVLPSGDHMLVVVDYFSRFIEVEFMRSINANATIKKLDGMFARFGFPLSITADNAKQFVGKELQEYCEVNNIRLVSTIPYWPRQNGEVERQNRSLLKRLIISQNAGRNWQEDLNKYLLMYRATKHSTTLRAPSELMFGRCIRDKLPSTAQPIEVDEELQDRDKEQKEKGRVYGDDKRGARPSDINVGDRVLAKRQIITNKLSSPFETTVYKVIKRQGSEITIQSTETNSIFRRNVAHLKALPPDMLVSQESSTRAAILSPIATPAAVPELQTSASAISPPSPKRTRRAPSRLGFN